MTTVAASSKDQAQAVSTSTLHAFLSLAKRRFIVIAVCAVLAANVALLLAVTQQPLYQASARVLLTYENFAAAVTSTPDSSTVLQQPERVAQTQVSLARLPTLATRTLRAAGQPTRSFSDFLAASSVSVEPNADLLTFRVVDEDPRLAARLATEYARQFTAYRRTLDTAALRQARAEVEQSLTQLRAASDTGGALYAELLERQGQLRALESLQTSSAFLVDPARRGVQIEPRPVRNEVLGLLLGLLVGFGLAYLWDRLDTRVRSAEEIEAQLGLPLLGSLAGRPRHPPQSLAMLAEGDGPDAEGFRVLRNSIELASLDRHARVLMVTSAVAGEGKSTTAANLAIAFARAGKRVVLVDLDLRDPDQHHLFDVVGRPGLADVVLGKATMDEALTTIAVVDQEPRPVTWNHNGGGGGARGGVLDVLTIGPLPPDPGEFVGSQALSAALDELRARSDLVLLDCSPLLGVGDAVVLSLKSDAMIVVTRLGVTRTTMLREARRVLEACRAHKLGFVFVGARLDKHLYRPRKRPRRVAAPSPAKKALRPIRRS